MKKRKEYQVPRTKVVKLANLELLAGSPPYIPVDPDPEEMDPDDDAG